MGAEPGQVLIAWGRKRGYSVIPKSVTKSRIENNFQQVKLSDEDYKTVTDFINEHGGHHRFNIPVNYSPVSTFKCIRIAELLTDLFSILKSWDIRVFDEDVELKCTHRANIGN
jgi:L-glyceraldehyde reductase